jgi:hypothetical protein
MTAMKSISLAFCTLVFWSCGPRPLARAETATYTIDAAQSRISVVPSTFSGNSVVAGSYFASYGIAAQKPATLGLPGSLDSTVSGSLTATVTGSTLTFTGQNILDVPLHPRAPFDPQIAGSPSVENDFGANILENVNTQDGIAAISDISAKIVGGSATLGQPATNLSFALASGTLDYSFFFFGDYYPLAPSVTVSNQAPASFSGSINGTIHIPFHLEYPFAAVTISPDSLLVLDGEIVATRATTPLLGDYNNNHVVDAADYTVWRDNLNKSVTLPNDSTPGTVVAADYDVWKSHFGQTASGAAVPEPTTLALNLIALLFFCSAASKHFFHHRSSRDR